MKNNLFFQNSLKRLRSRKILVFLALPFLFILAFNQFRWLQELNSRNRIQSEEMIKQEVRRLIGVVYSEIIFLPMNISRKGVSNESFSGFFDSWSFNTFSPKILSGFFCADKSFSLFYRWQDDHFESDPVKADAYENRNSIFLRASLMAKKNADFFIGKKKPLKKPGPSDTPGPGSVFPEIPEDSAFVFASYFFSDRQNLYVITKPSFATPGEFCVFVFDRNEIKENLFVHSASEIFGRDFKYSIKIFDDSDGSILYTNTEGLNSEKFAVKRISLPRFIAPARPEPPVPPRHGPQRDKEAPPVPAPLPPHEVFYKVPVVEYIKLDSVSPDSYGKKGLNLEAFADFFPEIQISAHVFQTTIRDQYVLGTIRNVFITAGIFILILVLFFVLLNAERRAENLAIRQQEFIATITHELKTPIAVISSAAQNLTVGIITDKEKITKYGELIKTEADRLALSINHYLLYAGTDPSAPGRTKMEPCSVRDIIMSVLSSSEPERNRLGFTTEVTFPEKKSPGGMLSVYGNSLALESAFSNIVLNAIRHACSGKYLGISAWFQRDFPEYTSKKIYIKSLSQVKKNNPAGFVCVSFSDRGNGIDDEEIKTIFEPFVRGKNALKNQTPGNGIGLSLVAKVVAVHGGAIFIETKKDRGTTFILVFPAAHLSEENSEEHEDAAQNFNDRG